MCTKERWRATPFPPCFSYKINIARPHPPLPRAPLQRYQKEFTERAAALGVTEAELRASEAAAKGGGGSTGDIGDLEVVIPLARVKRIAKLNPEVKNVSKEATALVAKATEFFLGKFSEEAFKMASLSGR